MSGAARPTPRIWIDCDDLLGHFDGWSTPTGICRVQLEIIPHLLEMAPERIVLCRIGRSGRDLQVLPPGAIEKLRKRSGSRPTRTPLPYPLERVIRFAYLRASHRFRQAALRAGLLRPDVRPEPGDWILAMGGTWNNPGFPRAIEALRAKRHIRLAHLVHDILPATDPDLVADRHVARFADWIHRVGMLSDRLLTPSRHAATELTAHLARSGMRDVPVAPITFGAGFSISGDTVSCQPLPAQPYVLFVSTIEVRKNHLFLARVWKRLVEKHGATAIPTLLLVGRFGWKTRPFARFLEKTRNLDGKIVVRSGLSDAELDRTYAGCLFTVFPSFAEGWGLPVAESLAHGKACVASRATSIPEVGGNAADYFDPKEEASAIGAIERMLFEPGYREGREAWIRTRYRPGNWAHTAGEILTTLASDDDRCHADR